MLIYKGIKIIIIKTYKRNRCYFILKDIFWKGIRSFLQMGEVLANLSAISTTLT